MRKFRKSKMTEKANFFLGSLLLVWETLCRYALFGGLLSDLIATRSEGC